MRLVGYGRLSSREQAEGQTREQQEHRLRQAGASRIFFDIASGSLDDRPQLMAALKALEQGDADGIVCTRLDRLTRNASFNSKLCDLFGSDHGPTLLALDDSVDTSTIMGRAMFRISGVFAQAEVERIRERTTHGLTHRRDVLGAHQGRAPFGYIRLPGALQLTPDPETAPIAVALIDQFIATADARATAVWLQETHGIRMPPRSLRAWLALPTLAGDSGRSHPRPTINGKRAPVKPGWLRIDRDTHPPLISRAKAAELQRALEISAKSTGGARRGHLRPEWFSSRFKCATCRHTMRRHRERLICPNPLCPDRYGRNAVTLPALRRELLRGLFWLGRGLIVRLAPEAAATSKTVVECPEALELRGKIAALRSTGVPEVQATIQHMEQQLQALTATNEGFQESAAAAAKRLDGVIGQWSGLQRLLDEDLLALLRDAEISGVIHDQRLRLVRSDRWEPMVWLLDSDGSDVMLSTAPLVLPRQSGSDPGAAAEELKGMDWMSWAELDGEVYLTVIALSHPAD